MSLSIVGTTDESRPASICATYGEHAEGSTTAANGGEYCAVVDQPYLPGAQEDDEVNVCRGAAVDLGDRWVFFDDLAPAAGFVRAGLRSNLMLSWDLFEAAEVRAHCPEHGRDERALLLGRELYEEPEMRRLLTSFAASPTPDPLVRVAQ